ncbi:hypothetical protein FRC17_008643, partial [Serendipita sp. 399]
GDLNDQEKTLKRQQAPISGDIDEIKTAITKVKKLERSLDEAKAKLTAERGRAPKEQREKKLKANLIVKAKERLDAVSKLQVLIADLNTKTAKFTRTTFESLQIMANIAAMEQIVHKYGTATRDLEKEVNELGTQVQALEAERTELANTVQRMVETVSPEITTRQQAYVAEHDVESVNLEALDEQRVAVQAELAATSQVNRAVIQQLRRS